MGTPAPGPPQGQPRTRNYFIGIGLGFIPLVLVLLALANSAIGNILGSAGLISYGALLIATIVCLVIGRIRFIGYGLLTMVFVGPVVYFIACTVQLSRVG